MKMEKQYTAKRPYSNVTKLSKSEVILLDYEKSQNSKT